MTDKWLIRFQKEALPIIKREFKPESVIIFGSRVKGNAQEDSDIDVIVVSQYFDEIPFLRRMPLISKKVSFPKHVDYFCYTPDEYIRMKDESSIIMDALENALEIAM